MNLTEQFLKFALATGANWVMILLLCCSILSVGIIVDRIIYFMKFKGDFSKFIEILTQKLSHNESVEKISAWCSGQTLLESQVAAVGLEKSLLSPKAAEESMNAAMISAKTKLERGTIILGTLGNNTPFIGLFGTIIGIIHAFHALGKVGAGLDASQTVMSSIAESLVATAFGILVAIPAVISYNFFNRAIKKKISNSDATARIILTHIGVKTGE